MQPINKTTVKAIISLLKNTDYQGDEDFKDITNNKSFVDAYVEVYNRFANNTLNKDISVTSKDAIDSFVNYYNQVYNSTSQKSSDNIK